ncbi:hypothetical protein AWB81_01806 [Caballeronia arationis]|uniref:hypothetical protein n=1 Tax=Caballeronia arationis TaxID=1777142 RepID=UPI00074C901B|nr:hypothetical protein [Caballeronia arationis]SAK59193.1 hypothetical protein AWB81_01806 [Caballeronia arationis]
MSPIEFIGKLVWSAWPFVKEMVLDGKSLAYAFRNSKRRAIFSIVIMASFTLNLVNLSADVRLLSILAKYLEVEKEYKTSRAEVIRLKARVERDCLPPEPAAASLPAASATPPEPPHAAPPDSYQALKSTFAGLQAAHR